MKHASETYSNVWDALTDTPEEAENMKLRSALMLKIRNWVNAHEWTQAVAAKKLGITQPRLNDLLKGRISKFSLDALVNIAAAAGLHVQVEIVEIGAA
jgi:predicted XRE-type DNA-binding protein